MPKINRTNSKGLIQETGIGAAGIPFTESVTLKVNDAATKFVSSSGLVQPLGTFIKSITIICTTTHAAGAGNIGVQVGTAAGGTQVVDLDADSLVANNAAFAAGKGSSSRGEVKTALQGAANLVVVPGQPYTSVKRTLFPEVVAAGGNITAGEYKCIVEFAS
jgi:hypothetical protein